MMTNLEEKTLAKLKEICAENVEKYAIMHNTDGMVMAGDALCANYIGERSPDLALAMRRLKKDTLANLKSLEAQGLVIRGGAGQRPRYWPVGLAQKLSEQLK